MSQRKSRELALQMLFQRELTAESPEEVEELFWLTREAGKAVRERAVALFRLAVARIERIDPMIEKATRNWQLERLGNVDRNLLRLAAAEMLFGATPPAVVIDEAVEIARRFGSDRSPEFVNGVLDRIRQEHEEEKQ